MDDKPCEQQGGSKVLGSRFPVFTIRTERVAGPETLQAVWEYLAWSINCMFVGKYPATGFRGAPIPQEGKAGCYMYGGQKLRLVEVRGDWKQHVESFKLVHHYTSMRICHQCLASRADPAVPFCDFRRNASWKGTIRSHQQFLLEEVGEPINSLLFVARFDYTMIKYDAMHSVNLGCGLHANGGAFYELMKVFWWGRVDQGSVFRNAYRSFKDFLRRFNIQCSQPQFKTWMLVSKGDDYCFFASKASSC